MAFANIEIYESYMEDIGTPLDPLQVIDLMEQVEDEEQTTELENWTGLAGRGSQVNQYETGIMQVDSLGEKLPDPKLLRMRREPKKVPVYDSTGEKLTSHSKAIPKADGTGYVEHSTTITRTLPKETTEDFLKRIAQSGEDKSYYAEHTDLEIQVG